MLTLSSLQPQGLVYIYHWLIKMLSKEVYLTFSTKENADGLVKLASHNPIWEEYSNTPATILDKINGTSGPPLSPPPHHFNDAKMARFCSFAPSSLLLGGGRGLIVPFYSVQNCSFRMSPALASNSLTWQNYNLTVTMNSESVV